MPIYWLCTLVFILLIDRPPVTVKTEALAAWLDSKGHHLSQSFLFIPSEIFPVLGVGWTLNFEMYFYIVFSVALFLSQKFAPLIAGGIVYAVIKLPEYGINNWLSASYSHAYIHYFNHGIVVFYIWSLAKFYMPKYPTILICVATIACIYSSQFYPPQQRFSEYGSTYFPSALVAAALFAASSGADVKWRPLVLIGDASYAIYLTHVITMQWLEKHLPPWKVDLVMALSIVVISTVVGIAVHLYAERPLLNAIRRHKTRRLKTSLV